VLFGGHHHATALYQNISHELKSVCFTPEVGTVTLLVIYWVLLVQFKIVVVWSWSTQLVMLIIIRISDMNIIMFISLILLLSIAIVWKLIQIYWYIYQLSCIGLQLNSNMTNAVLFLLQVEHHKYLNIQCFPLHWIILRYLNI
jgi:hypothetical protein